MRPPPPLLPPAAVACVLLFTAWVALATPPEASAATKEFILEAVAHLAVPGEREGHGARLGEGQDELEVVGSSRRVTKRHGDSQVRMCSAILPSCLAVSAKFTLAQAESGRQWNT